DGTPDVAAATDANGIWLFLGAGDGTLHQAPGSPLTTGDYPDSLSLTDVDLDGHRDVVYFSGYYRVHALTGDGKGGFSEPVTLVAPRVRPRDVLVADFDQSRGPDLVLDETGVVRPYMNDGRGGFAEAEGSPFITSHWNSATASDVTSDGYADLVGVT